MNLSAYKRGLFKRGLPGAALLVFATAAYAVAAYAVLACTAPAYAAVDFDALKKEVPDAVAWIQIPETILNYPVVQTTDNSFYLTRLPDGRASDNGSIFMDARNTPDFTDKNTLIHGHRMKSGTMFGALRNYVMQAYYDRHPIVLLFTPQGDYQVLLFAGYVFDQSVETFPLRFDGDEPFMNYVAQVKERSMFKSGVEVNPEDLIVTLLTCDTEYDSGRLMLIGKLMK